MLDTPIERYIAMAIIILVIAYIYLGNVVPLYEKAKNFLWNWTPTFKFIYRG